MAVFYVVGRSEDGTVFAETNKKLRINSWAYHGADATPFSSRKIAEYVITRHNEKLQRERWVFGLRVLERAEPYAYTEEELAEHKAEAEAFEREMREIYGDQIDE
jgi:hypothetical protein